MISSQSKYLLYVVPKKQQESSSQARIYGGYHITLFSDTNLPPDFDMKKMMKTFNTSNKMWQLPGGSELYDIKSKGLYMIGIISRTLTKLLDHFQEPNGPFDVENRWEPLHMTLGENRIPEPVSAEDLYDVFMDEKEWYVQLVKKTPLYKHSGYDPLHYKWEWLPSQRVPLYHALDIYSE